MSESVCTLNRLLLGRNRSIVVHTDMSFETVAVLAPVLSDYEFDTLLQTQSISIYILRLHYLNEV